MMPPARTEVLRQVTLEFAGKLEAAAGHDLCHSISALSGVQKVEYGEERIFIEYEFPACSYDQIWVLVNGLPQHRTWKIRGELRAFMEKNERQHLQFPQCWQHYVRDVYVHYHDLGPMHNGVSHKHLWRRHQYKH
ncbi:MAG: hypothetical protein MI865_08280 [Proteobacteria bacterium]|nr:hypothetical protein [Pseudomonadota bacterium]